MWPRGHALILVGLKHPGTRESPSAPSVVHLSVAWRQINGACGAYPLLLPLLPEAASAPDKDDCVVDRIHMARHHELRAHHHFSHRLALAATPGGRPFVKAAPDTSETNASDAKTNTTRSPCFILRGHANFKVMSSWPWPVSWCHAQPASRKLLLYLSR